MKGFIFNLHSFKGSPRYRKNVCGQYKLNTQVYYIKIIAILYLKTDLCYTFFPLQIIVRNMHCCLHSNVPYYKVFKQLRGLWHLFIGMTSKVSLASR